MRLKFFSCFLLIILLVPSISGAQWIPDGVPICTADNVQFNPVIISDDIGGAIIAWCDDRNYSNAFEDLYAQRVDSSGVVKWATNGVPVCTTIWMQQNPVITSDGAGGAIIAWHDINGEWRIFAQRIDSSGGNRWGLNGVAICTWYPDVPKIVSDSKGGAIITWVDYRNSGMYDIYAQRVDSSGVVRWAVNGVPVCTGNVNQLDPVITSDGVGGAIIAWWDDRAGNYNFDIYAQRIDSSGTLKWSVNGVPICTSDSGQRYPVITSDGANGAIIAWRDFRNGNYDIYAQWVDSAGTVRWTTNGVAICTAANSQDGCVITSDGVGGAIIAWHDARDGNDDIYAQRVDSSGVVKWVVNGVPICTADSNQSSPVITSDGASGVIIAWHDARSGVLYRDIYVQRVDSTGTVQWVINGIAICTAVDLQQSPKIISDGAGGAIITWEDWRFNIGDIYAQRVYADGGVGGVEIEQTSASPMCHNLLHVYPNPFSKLTTVSFGIEHPDRITHSSYGTGSAKSIELKIYDVSGRLVKQFNYLTNYQSPVLWSGDDDFGHEVPAGVYFVYYGIDNFMMAQKVIKID
jgi:hypothetical protein